MPQPPAPVRRAVVRMAVVLTALAGLQTLSVAPAMATGSPPATSASGTSAASTPTPTATASTATGSTPTSPRPTPRATAEATPTPTPRATSSAAPSVTPSAGSAAAAATPGATPTVTRPVAAAAAPAALTVEASTSPATIDRSGQSLRTTVVVRSTGGEAVRDLTVSAVAPGLPALTCTPTAQGGTLAAGSSTTCSATRTSTQADLRARTAVVSVSAVGFAPAGGVVSAQGSAELGVAAEAPVATDDQVTVLATAGSVVLPGSRNDHPAVAGGPAIDPAATRLDAGPFYDPVLSIGDWQVLSDGSVRYTIGGGGTISIRYRTTDVLGRTSEWATLTVTVREGAKAQPDTTKTRQGSGVGIDVLANDRPGQYRSGTRASFDDYTLSFPDDQPVLTARRLDEHFLELPGVGNAVVSAGQIGFSPERTFVGTTSFAYEVTDTIGSVTRATVTVTVTAVVPTVATVTGTTRYLHATDLDLGKALAVGTAAELDFGGFVSRDGTNLGISLTTAEGSWYYPAYGGTEATKVTFYPAPGFSGTATALFEAIDNNRTHVRGTLRVTVRDGWSAQPDTARTTAARDVTINPLANDVANQRADGTPGRFDLARLAFSGSGQPQGGVVAANGKSITLPGRGDAWISNGRVTFRPAPGFTGSAGRLALDVRDDGSAGMPQPLDVLLDRVSVYVASTAPAATDDSATGVLGEPVTLKGSTNDDPGAAARPLPTSFPVAGQPSGSVLTGGGTRLAVPRQGVWSVNPSGSVTFTPDPGFVDGASPVVYRVAGAQGTSATASLFVSVARGPQVLADVIARPRRSSGASTLDPLVDDLPGIGADGRRGRVDLTSVRFPTDGQPVGAVASADGRVLTVPADGRTAAFVFTADPTSGLVALRTDRAVTGPSPTVAYQVQDTVRGSAGTEVHRLARSTLQAVFAGRDPVASDDAAPWRRDDAVVLAGGRNDFPGSGSIVSVSFPSDQLAGLPAGSTIKQYPSEWVAVVPGEGTWVTQPDTSVTFFSEEDFRGAAITPLRYRVLDSAGGVADAMLRLTFASPSVPAIARPDTASTRQGVDVQVRPLDNDTPGRLGDGTTVPLVPGNLIFTGTQGGTIPLDSDSRVQVMPGEGRYTIAVESGVVTFSPDPSFSGRTTPVRVSARSPISTITVDVTPVVPRAADDQATTKATAAVRVGVLANDVAGDQARPLVPGSVLLLGDRLPAGAELSADSQVVAVPDWGSFAVAGDGSVTFRPLGKTGTAPAVTYSVQDANGTRTTATVTVRVG